MPSKVKLKVKAKPKAKSKKPPAKVSPVAKGKPAAKKSAAAKAAAVLAAGAATAKGAVKAGTLSKTGKPRKSLLIVESPAKARTIKKYLGSAFLVKASVGHIKDLPKSKIGVDTENDFTPVYKVIPSKVKVIAEIRAAARLVDKVYLAPDPDREGEAIAFHLADEIKDINTNVHRVLINEITKKGVNEALLHPTTLNSNMYDAQQARRVLDRLVGYTISPVLWNKVKRGLSAGRVQSVAVRIVVERDREIGAFLPVEYWSVEIDCEGPNPPPFMARLVKWDGDKTELKVKADADEAVREIREATLVVAKVERKERRRNPAPPFITSKLQQEAARKLRYTAKKTMALAQQLYEGMDLGEEGPVGLITYMRTDSVRLSDDSLKEVRDYIGARFGQDFLPDAPIVYKVAKQAQGAHEAIRPTSLRFDPDTVRKLLIVPLEGKDDRGAHGVNVHDKLSDYEDALKLYTLIWNRFVACQMTPAVYDQTAVDIAAGKALLRANGQIMKFAGYTQVYLEGVDDEAAQKAEEQDKVLPPLAEGDAIALKKISPEQHFTQPPPRFSEASLVKELEEKGIGRPSTYASIMSTIQDRGYVEKREGRFFPTELGVLVNDLLVESFPDILNVDFTAQMEEQLDEVAEGQNDWVKVLRGFYTPFQKDVENAALNMRDVKREEIPTDLICEKSGDPMVIKWGRNGSFLACKAYPECKNTKEFMRLADGSIKVLEPPVTTELCDKCGAAMLYKRGRFGEFLACSRYPECDGTKPVSIGVLCPKPGCGGFLTAKRSRRGKVFYGCSNYAKTKCDFVTWDLPVPEPCPSCGAAFLVKRELKSGDVLKCVTEGCGYTTRKGGDAEEGAPDAPDGAAL